jgi:hypothetical protein
MNALHTCFEIKWFHNRSIGSEVEIDASPNRYTHQPGIITHPDTMQAGGLRACTSRKTPCLPLQAEAPRPRSRAVQAELRPCLSAVALLMRWMMVLGRLTDRLNTTRSVERHACITAATEAGPQDHAARLARGQMPVIREMTFWNYTTQGCTK